MGEEVHGPGSQAVGDRGSQRERLPGRTFLRTDDIEDIPGPTGAFADLDLAGAAVLDRHGEVG
jgi:hypothetical protein